MLRREREVLAVLSFSCLLRFAVVRCGSENTFINAMPSNNAYST